MTMSATTTPRLHLGEPQVSGPLAVYPIFGAGARLRYRSLARAVNRGAFIGEVDEHGEVNEVLVCNASNQPVLLYEGELIEGARQNRTIDQPVLVPRGVELRVPVSCVEQGRWEHGRRAARFTAGRSTAGPDLRAAKRAQANLQAAAGLDARPEQGEVWRDVDAALAEFGVESMSGALTDVYTARRGDLDRVAHPITALDGQVGALVQISGTNVAFDFVSRPRAFAELLPRLADGYALQVLRWQYTAFAAPSPDEAEKFLASVNSSPRAALPNPGMGDTFRPTRVGLAGCGLEAGGELIALSAFMLAQR